MSMSRLFSALAKYKWELGLLVGIPFVSSQVVWLSALGIGSLLSAIEYDPGTDGAIRIILSGAGLAGGIVGLLFLSLLYRRVKALDRVFLRSLWTYSIAVQAITVVGEIVNIVLVVVYPLDSLMLVSLRITGVALIEMLATFVVFLWYARQLSRVSLTYAFFLVAFTTLAMVGPIQGASRSGTWAEIMPAPMAFIVIYYLLPVLVRFADEAVKAWFVGNFEWRGERFRKKATIIVTGLVILSPYLWAGYWTLVGLAAGPYHLTHTMLGPLAGFGIILAVQVGMIAFLFGSVYLVRVRKPKTEIVENNA